MSQAALIATAFLQVGLLWGRYESVELSLTVAALAFLGVGMCFLFVRMGRAVATGRSGVLHMMLLLMMPVVASALYVRPALVTWMVKTRAQHLGGRSAGFSST